MPSLQRHGKLINVEYISSLEFSIVYFVNFAVEWDGWKYSFVVQRIYQTVMVAIWRNCKSAFPGSVVDPGVDGIPLPLASVSIAGRLIFWHIQNLIVRNFGENWLSGMRKYAAFGPPPGSLPLDLFWDPLQIPVISLWTISGSVLASVDFQCGPLYLNELILLFWWLAVKKELKLTT